MPKKNYNDKCNNLFNSWESIENGQALWVSAQENKQECTVQSNVLCLFSEFLFIYKNSSVFTVESFGAKMNFWRLSAYAEP